MDQVVDVARHRHPLSVPPEVAQAVARSRRLLEGLIAGGTRMYGVTTGVGALSQTPVSPAQACRLSENIIMSHACGVGDPLSEEQVRAIMACAVANFGQGRSGVRPALVETLVAMLNAGVTPRVPRQGGMGSLTHMAHVGLVLFGLGEAWFGGRLVSGREAMTAAGIALLPLAEKEGLSLVNGTVSKTGLASLILYDARRLACWADVAGAASFEALRGVPAAFDPRIHEARPHPGQVRVARNLLALTRESELLDQGQRLQDALSLRAMPQVHGACRDQIEHAVTVVTRELNAATDNPLLFEEAGGPGVALSGCNAHGEPIALVLDSVCVALTELSSISERRTDRLVNHHVSGLPPFLVRGSGLSSGFMIPQYVSASLVAENKVLSHPISVDSIPTTALQEDHWSMGTPGALKAHQVLLNAWKVVAIELLTACQALEFRPGRMGRGTRAAYEAVRSQVARWDEDRVFYPDLDAVIGGVTGEAWLRQVETAAGSLR